MGGLQRGERVLFAERGELADPCEGETCEVIRASDGRYLVRFADGDELWSAEEELLSASAVRRHPSLGTGQAGLFGEKRGGGDGQ
ncbi:MAG: hypothetical protein GEU88_10235 [Solirubrobacterales bacterium]|nr:hypothetical protein [Solirubrobacterales bacterium]